MKQSIIKEKQEALERHMAYTKSLEAAVTDAIGAARIVEELKEKHGEQMLRRIEDAIEDYFAQRPLDVDSE